MSDLVLRHLQREAVADPENVEKAIAYVRALAHEATVPKAEKITAKGGPIVINHAIKLTFNHTWRWNGLPLKLTAHVEAQGVGRCAILSAEAEVLDDELLISVRRLPEDTPTPDSFVAPSESGVAWRIQVGDVVDVTEGLPNRYRAGTYRARVVEVYAEPTETEGGEYLVEPLQADSNPNARQRYALGRFDRLEVVRERRQCQNLDSRNFCCVHREGHESVCRTSDGVEFGCFDNCGDPTRHIGD